MARALFVTAFVLLIVTTVVFAINARHRHHIDELLKKAPPVARPITSPERPLSYGAEDFKALKQRLESQAALDFYVRPVLIWNDLIFGIALAGFVVASWLWIVVAFDVRGFLRGLFILFAAMGFLYGVFDVAEDLYLARLLSKPDDVTAIEASIANALTTAKLYTIASSIQGGVVFGVLSWAFSQPDAAGRSTTARPT